MPTLFLTSALDIYEKDENNTKIPHPFGNKNGILDTFKAHIKKYDNFLFVGRGGDDFPRTLEYAYRVFASFNLTLPFKNYDILDIPTKENANQLIKNADFIFLCGGHLPTQNKFFNEINLKKLINKTNAVICGGSAGSMNCADVVYCPPEVEGEGTDSNFNRYLQGLGLTDINILPHYNEFKNHILDGKKFIQEIIFPDTFKTKVIALNDGSYILQDGKSQKIYGECFLIKNGQITQICKDNETVAIS